MYVTLPKLMYEHYRGCAGDTGGYGVSIYVHCNRSGFVDGSFIYGQVLLKIYYCASPPQETSPLLP